MTKASKRSEPRAVDPAEVAPGLRGTKGRVAALAIRGVGVRAIGRALGVSHVTVVRHLQDERVRSVVDNALLEVAEEATRIARAHAANVIQAEVGIATGVKKGDSAQVAAIRHILAIAGIRETPARLELSGALAVRTGPLADLTDEEIAAKLDEARRATDGEPAGDDGA